MSLFCSMTDISISWKIYRIYRIYFLSETTVFLSHVWSSLTGPFSFPLLRLIRLTYSVFHWTHCVVKSIHFPKLTYFIPNCSDWFGYFAISVSHVGPEVCLQRTRAKVCEHVAEAKALVLQWPHDICPGQTTFVHQLFNWENSRVCG